MGFRLRGVIRCGPCGKPRGIRHTCVTSAAGSKRKGRTRLQSPLEWRCKPCGQKRGIVHTCAPKSDFKARKRKAAMAERQRKQKAARARRAGKRREARKAATARRNARRKQAAAERRARDKARKAAAKAAKTRPARPRGDSHEPGTCGDRDCPKYGCKAYWAGMEDCPLPHNG
ncbi:MAG TPA: hypothetical protein VKU77_09380 [Streptosporangiaceae bacterium]|nr:hypothetical protein [Streptosporangiaceae bacterium]